MATSLRSGQDPIFIIFLVFNNRQEAKHDLLTLLCQLPNQYSINLFITSDDAKISVAFIILDLLSVPDPQLSTNPHTTFVANTGVKEAMEYTHCLIIRNMEIVVFYFFKDPSKQKYKIYILPAFLQFIVKYIFTDLYTSFLKFTKYLPMRIFTLGC